MINHVAVAVACLLTWGGVSADGPHPLSSTGDESSLGERSFVRYHTLGFDETDGGETWGADIPQEGAEIAVHVGGSIGALWTVPSPGSEGPVRYEIGAADSQVLCMTGHTGTPSVTAEKCVKGSPAQKFTPVITEHGTRSGVSLRASDGRFLETVSGTSPTMQLLDAPTRWLNPNLVTFGRDEVDITSPLDGGYVAKEFTLAGYGDVSAEIAISFNGDTVCSTIVGARPGLAIPGVWRCPISTLPDGPATLHVDQIDETGRASEDEITLIVGDDAPDVPVIAWSTPHLALAGLTGGSLLAWSLRSRRHLNRRRQ